jgi:hypothetical protein
MSTLIVISRGTKPHRRGVDSQRAATSIKGEWPYHSFIPFRKKYEVHTSVQRRAARDILTFTRQHLPDTTTPAASKKKHNHVNSTSSKTKRWFCSKYCARTSGAKRRCAS